MLSSSEACQRAAIWGLGGCGKTAIALEFAYRTRKLRPRCSVFWVPAISRQSFEEAYRAIGALLQIPGIEDEKADVKGLVQRALSNERAGEWLLVVDNADDVDVLFREGDDESRLIDYLPRSRNGSILFTTRTRKAAIDQVGSQSIELFEMNRAEALEFFSKTLNRKEFLEGDEVSKLLELLAYLPLAIVQAAAFLNKNEVRISEYIGLLRETPDDEIELLSRDFEDRSRYREIRNPVAITWIISFEQIQKHDPLAALGNQGKYGEAEETHREVLALREKVLGKEHPNTLTSMHEVAYNLGKQGKYGEAEETHREVLALREKVLGKEHP
ncbi:Kinesin light chain, partial [Lasiodiplodia theobromae]|uniref:Kinesin light chain n=1 Tax=Lasiodiplodia theobromae TaxID=45133 RepID=UPI0015C39309